MVNVDPVHFMSIIHNLLDNAQKYCNQKPLITIRTKNINQQLWIEIKDNGIGITPHAQKKIFDKFYRVPKGDQYDVQGFGLGLFYVKTMIEAHGGTIKVSSTPGAGTQFFITLKQKV